MSCIVLHTDTCHATKYRRSNTQMAQYQPLIHTNSLILNVFPWLIPWRTVPQALSIDRTLQDPRSMIRFLNKSTAAYGSAASSAEACKVAHYPRPSSFLIDERRYTLTTLAVESFWPLGKSGIEIIGQLGTSVVGGVDNGNLHRKQWRKTPISSIIMISLP